MLLAHLGFALAGLAVWSAYLLTGLAALAWAALLALLPVAGLGMATLILTIPDPNSGQPATSQPGSGPGSEPGPLPALVPAGGASGPARADSARAGRARADGSAVTTREAAVPGKPRPARPPVLLIAAHGALATATILLALLGAVAAVASH